MLKIVRKLTLLRGKHFIKIPLTELARYRAQALAGSGNLPQALTEYRRYENQPGLPGWLYKAALAGVYDIAGEHDKALECAMDSLQQKETVTVYIDLANRYLRFKEDVDKAQVVLSKVDKLTIPELAQPFLLRCRGILSLLEGDAATAKELLQQYLQIMAKKRYQPYWDGSVNIAKAYLCCAFAQCGEVGPAEKLLEEARAYLVATRESDLLAKCEALVAVHLDAAQV